MGVYSNQRVGTVLECQYANARLAQAMDDFSHIHGTILSDDVALGENYLCDLLIHPITATICIWPMRLISPAIFTLIAFSQETM